MDEPKRKKQVTFEDLKKKEVTDFPETQTTRPGFAEPRQLKEKKE